MTAATEALVDTRLMEIIHRAFLRDLRRINHVLLHTDLSEERRVAVAEHSLWLMDLLLVHEREEETALWPRLGEASPDAAHLLGEIDRDHVAIRDLIAEVQASSGRWRDHPSAQAELQIAVGLLEGVLLPHLRREEREALPLAAKVLTAEDWKVYADTKVDGKSKADLAYQGHWALDDLGTSGVQLILGMVSPVSRMVLVHGFGRRYRRAAATRWGGQPADYGPRGSEHRDSFTD